MEFYNRVVLNKESIDGIRIVAEKEHGTSKGFIMNEQLAMQENISVDNAIDNLRGYLHEKDEDGIKKYCKG